MAIISKQEFSDVIWNLIDRHKQSERLNNEHGLNVFDDILEDFRIHIINILGNMFELEEDFTDPKYLNIIDFYIDMCLENEDYLNEVPPERFYDELIEDYKIGKQYQKFSQEQSDDYFTTKFYENEYNTDLKFRYYPDYNTYSINVPYHYNHENYGCSKYDFNTTCSACSNNCKKIRKRDIFGDIDTSKL